MKTVLAILFFPVIVLMSCLLESSDFRPIKPVEIVSDKIILTVSKNLKQEFDLNLSGIGGGATKDGVWDLTATYIRRGKEMCDINEARELILSSIHKFLNEANNNEEFRPLMQTYPFTDKNLSITIIIHDKNGESIPHPCINSISLYNGNIYYRNVGPNRPGPYVQTIKESYEEALENSKLNAK